ncbi:Na+/H+ antiporter subunit E [Polyangium sp. y55x31]|uniref:Na+/H+ antiporter subunit E n=1 Tax=Polyangium sp. y55x31 TaxID=3042688 RepID=UPI002482E1D2|nr:Na+/H+ antiporter subunit E [Polyangium sp. y55x31]MDI1483618.1 Na+/H+ antiporter subunit E [Polyangium sp. y55x31]
MSALALNLLLAIVWMFIQASFSLRSLAVGFGIGFLAITFLQRLRGSHVYFLTAVWVVRLFAFFVIDLVRSNLTLARDILRPVPAFLPALVRFEVSDLSPVETALLANLVSLTPGTLTVDAEDDGSAIYVHALYGGDPDGVRRRIGRLARMIRRAGGRHQPPQGAA